MRRFIFISFLIVIYLIGAMVPNSAHSDAFDNALKLGVENSELKRNIEELNRLIRLKDENISRLLRQAKNMAVNIKKISREHQIAIRTRDEKFDACIASSKCDASQFEEELSTLETERAHLKREVDSLRLVVNERDRADVEISHLEEKVYSFESGRASLVAIIEKLKMSMAAQDANLSSFDYVVAEANQAFEIEIALRDNRIDELELLIEDYATKEKTRSSSADNSMETENVLGVLKRKNDKLIKEKLACINILNKNNIKSGTLEALEFIETDFENVLTYSKHIRELYRLKKGLVKSNCIQQGMVNTDLMEACFKLQEPDDVSSMRETIAELETFVSTAEGDKIFSFQMRSETWTGSISTNFAFCTINESNGIAQIVVLQ